MQDGPLQAIAQTIGALESASYAARSYVSARLTGFAISSALWAYDFDFQVEAAACVDSTPEELLRSALWPESPDWLNNSENQMEQRWAAAPDVWSFWKDFYLTLRDEGREPDWPLWHDVALIPDEDWEKGPEHIARLIREIQDKHAKPRLDHEQIERQARRLLAQPQTTKIIAETTADQIEQAISDYMRLNSCNALPDGLEVFHDLPQTLRRIGEASQDPDRIVALEAQIEKLIGQVAVLTKGLEAAKGSSSWKTFKEQSIKTSATIITTTFLGGIAAGFSHMTGIVDVGTLFERLVSAAPVTPPPMGP